MNPDKLLRLLGYNNLSIILMQERRHWLMKTDRNKQIQDKITGDIFQGRLDNTGSDVVIESKKLPYRYDYTSEIKFNLTPANEVMDITLSALPYSATVNGLMYTRITSISYQYDLEQYSNYKIRFTNAEEVIIPFSASSSSKEVYAGKWLRTTTPPTMLLYDPTSQSHTYSITRILNFSSNVTNPVWYYPLEESLQPFEIAPSSRCRMGVWRGDCREVCPWELLCNNWFQLRLLRHTGTHQREESRNLLRVGSGRSV